MIHMPLKWQHMDKCNNNCRNLTFWHQFWFVWIHPHPYDTIEGGPMMWVLFAMDGNRQERKQLVVKHSALKWIKANSALPRGSLWRVPMAKWDDHDITVMVMVTIKQGRFKCIECTNKGDEFYNVFAWCTKLLKYDSSWHQIEGIHHI
jgi:hypothetical protein